MNMKCQEAEDFYNAMSHCVDGYIFICRHPDSEYEVTLPEEFVEEFSLSLEYKKHYFDEWILKIHEEDREKYQNNLQSILEKRADSICIQYRVKDKNADWVWLESRVYMKRNADGEAEMLAGVIRNLRKNNQLDHITGLLNKYAFREAAEEKIKNQTAFGVLLLNIDDFKHINELYDQYFGDSVLRSIGMYVQSRLDSNASVYRLNGDEFGILITNPQENQAKNLFQRISHHYSTQKELEGKRYYCTFSATYHKHENGTGYEEFIKSLKAAMTVVKRQGKNHMEDFMASNKLARTNDDIQFVMSKLLREIKDPRVQQGMISVTRVETTGDLRYSKIWLSVMGMKDEKEFKKGLKSASGWLRHELAGSMNLRYTPELVFEIDHSIEYGAHISQMISELDIKHDEDEDNEL